MAFLRLRPLVITFLLILTYGSGNLFLTSLSVMFISAIITFICFIFKIQLDFECVYSLVQKLRCWLKKGCTDHVSQFMFKDGPNKDSNLRLRNLTSLKDLPRPIARKLRFFIDGVMRDFVHSWYEQVGPNEKQFVNETRKALEMVAVEAYKRICNMDAHSSLVNLINLLTKHFKTFNDCCNAVNSKYPGIDKKDFEQCILELYETRVSPHITSKNQGAELDFLRKITDMLLFKLLPRNTFSCEGGRFMLREILAINGLYKLMNLLSDSHFLNKVLIDVFEEPVPLGEIIRKWKEEEENDLYSDEEKSGSESDELKIESDYESATDDQNKSKSLLMKSNQTYSSIDNVNEGSDNMESRYVTPNHSTTELSSAEETYDAFDRVLRQNQLEARLPAPVYGSTSVKLYDQSEDDASLSAAKSKTNFTMGGPMDGSPSESGAFEEIRQLRSFSTPMSTEISKDSTTKNRNSEDQNKQQRSAGVSRRNTEYFRKDENIDPTNAAIAGSWGYCPPSSSEFYRKRSYDKMSRLQDSPHEQLKAKFYSLGRKSDPVSCFNFNPQNQNELLEGSEKNQRRKNVDSIKSASSFACKDSENDLVEVSGEHEDFLRIHSVPNRNIIYEGAPNCPTCVEMTMLANPFKNLKPVMTEVGDNVREHECGMINPHLFYSDANAEIDIIDQEDNESFVSCDSDDPTDLESSTEHGDSETTLLASTESLGSNSSFFKVIHQLPGQKHQRNTDGYDILSLEGSDTEFSSANDFDESQFDGYLSENEDLSRSKDYLPRIARAPSVTTFASAVDSSIYDNESQQFVSPNTKIFSPIKSRKITNILKNIRLLSSARKKTKPKSEFAARFQGKRNSYKRKFVETSEDDLSDVPILQQTKSTSKPVLKKIEIRKDKKKASSFDSLSPSFHEVIQQSEKDVKLQRTLSGATDGSADISIDSLAVYDHTPQSLLDNQREEADAELGAELNEDLENQSQAFEDAKSMFEISSRDDETLESIIANCDETANDASRQADRAIPIFEGDMILPQAGDVQVSGWMYPMQMISIPKTEVAFEKGWEPGGNKYTLYSIHYDIRIWPEIYQRQLLEASVNTSAPTRETLPLIREIKRRYREFMYLHNRLTHSQMSEHMKGVLRPNRRYAMPFGRMDPDVIAGRRKILESYLVSLVSRQDVCNSREFKEFLGAEGYGNVSFIKPKLIKRKQIENKFVGNIRNVFAGTKDERGENSRYFIHGYDVPRMFGYSEFEALNRHSTLWFSNFVDVQIDRDIRPEGQQSTKQPNRSVIGEVEFYQKPTILTSHTTNLVSESERTIKTDELGPRSSGDGSEMPESANPVYRVESPERRFSVGIAALFSNELAARTRSETISMLDARKVAEEIPWPLSDAVMSFICQALKGYDCWVTYENVQQAVLYSLGGLLEWQISGLVHEIFIEERWMKYLGDIHDVIWEDGELIEPPPAATEDEKSKARDEVVEKFIEFLPAIVRIIIGPAEYKKWAKGLFHALQYEKINRHVLYSAIEVILTEFIPELQDGYPTYRTFTNTLKR